MDNRLITETARRIHAEWALRYLQRDGRLAPAWEDLTPSQQDEYRQEAQEGTMASTDSIEQQYYQAIDDWIAMIAELLQILHRGDLSYGNWHPEEWTSHAAELVGRYRRREDWQMLV